MTPTVTQRRILIGMVISVLAFLTVGVRLVLVTAFVHTPPPKTRPPVLMLGRADLLDRNGELIARDLPAGDLYARPKMIKDKHRAAVELSNATGADMARVTAVLKDKYPSALIARQVSLTAQAKVASLKLPGLEYLPNSKRFYPDGRTLAQVLGVTDLDGKGVSGLELGLEQKLHSNQPVATSLDKRVQFILAHETAAAMSEFRARAAGGLVLDVRTGEVLAMVSLPDFDPNTRQFEEGDSARNIMAQDIYELGSVFKIFTFALGLEDRKLRLDESLPVGNGYKIGRFTIHEAEHMPAYLGARDVLGQSSNIGSAQIALRSGGVRQREFLTSLGLMAPLKSELPERARPLYPSNWGIVETATIGFGHGISVSPLSFAAAAASIVNGGRRIQPTFVKHPEDGRGEQVISEKTSEAMRGLLRYVVTNGTGKKADVPGYDVGGKTGSAEKPGRRGYQAHKLMTSFCAVFPAENPRYLVFVLLDEPHGTKATGGFALAGHTAAPLAGHVISRVAPLLGVPINPITATKENT
ncbi:cell division protein FtsI (penicillin-binding protein 3) [Rhizomicrobium palustre]|uniref:Cell division protein FtsI (Penicillin-binding protein 3) n=1 Tax=Rhizomicrobium palustre TaxID=189966 RepID=A0A846MWZ3_9PROT|nr:penicillin-binding protein 2 [Rhizomicrobium palustre]NIK87507.1 cell division protein FtsI (penicillin-binding protein 3) [Rhizomicrobium palustre]